MLRRHAGLALLLATVIVPAVAGAHHSTAMFERYARVTADQRHQGIPVDQSALVDPGGRARARRQAGGMEHRVQQPKHTVAPGREGRRRPAGGTLSAMTAVTPARVLAPSPR